MLWASSLECAATASIASPFQSEIEMFDNQFFGIDKREAKAATASVFAPRPPLPPRHVMYICVSIIYVFMYLYTVYINAVYT